MRGMSKKDTLAYQVSLGLFAGLLGIASTAHGAPIYDGGTLAADGKKAGNVTIDTATANTTKITSTQPNNVIGWKDFSIKSTEKVEFDGGVTGTTAKNYLNIVTGNVTSHIDGEMKGGNNVYIANTHGVVFGKGASVDVGNLYVTTQDLTGVDYSQATNSAKIGAGTVIDTSTAKAAASAKADVVSLVDTAGKDLKANKIVLEGRSVRIMNDENIQSSEVYTLANTDPLTVKIPDTSGKLQDKTVRPYTGYVHVGYDTSNAAPSTGTGNKYRNLTKDNIYKLVANATKLNGMTTNDKDANYMLRKDITLPTGTPPGTPHTPIGTEAAPFKGRFDGMFHEISGLTFDTAHEGTPTEYVGLFGTTDGATIMNVGLKDANLSAVKFGGGLVGHAKGHTVISAVYNESSTGMGAGNYAGGLVGWLDSSSLDNAYNTAKVNNGGGLVGQFDGNSKIYAAYNTGEITSGVSYSVYTVYGTGVVTSGTDPAFIKDAYTNRMDLGPSANNNIVHNSYTTNSTGQATLVVPSGTATTGDAKKAATYAGWDISDEGGANTTWRIFAGQTTPLLTAFMKGTVQAEYSYADFQQANHGHSDNIASGYTVQAADKQTDGSYVKRAGTESNGGKDITKRTYNADYLKIAHKDGDNYTPVTSVDPTNDHDIKLYGAKDRSLVELSKADSQGNGGGGGRRNAGKEAMLFSRQHGYDIAGANVTIEKRKVVVDVEKWGKIEREYNGSYDAGEEFKKAITTGDVSTRVDGLVAGDGATMTLASGAATFHNRGDWSGSSASLSKDAGYNKAVYIDSSKVTFGDAENYDTDVSQINAKELTGNILQKTIKAKLTTATGIDKTYDGTSKVLKSQYQPDPNLILDSSTPLVGTNDVTLNQADVTVKYKDKATKSEVENAGAHDVAYEGVKLTSTTPGMTKNYKLVDQEGNVLYREAIDDDPNAAAAVTSGGTLWGTGTIERRKLDASHFSITGASKIYDGKAYLLVDGTEHKVEVAVNANAGTAADTTQKGLVEKDKNNLQFKISAADGKAYYKNASNANTKDVYSATSPNGAQFLSYTLKASGSALENYAFEGATTQDLTTAGTYDIKNAATIKPREITVDLLKKTGIDKTYDGNANVKDENKVFGANFGYADGTAKLVEGDGAKIEAKTAVYKKKAGAPEAADKDVSRVGDTATGTVTPNGKDVEYTIGLSDAIAAANYRLKYDTHTTNGGANDTITMTGAGTITPKKLTLASPGNVTRAYDGTSKVYKSQLPASYKNLDHTNGVVDNDPVHLDFDTVDPQVDPQVGTYYTDSTMKTEAKNANADKNGSLMSGKNVYTVKYTFTPKLDNGNYEVDATTPLAGQGTIKQASLDPTKFEMMLKDGKVEKTYDGTVNAPDDGLTSVQIGTETIYNGTGFSIERADSKYYYGSLLAERRDANVDESGNALAGFNTYGVQYKITLNGNAKNNYDLSGLNGKTEVHGGTYTVDGSTIAFKKDGIGYIKSRKIYVSLGDSVRGTMPKNTPTKVYDGTDKLNIDGATNGEFLVKFALGSGSGSEPTGLVGGNGKNASTGAYESRNAGDPKKNSLRDVVYTPKVSGVPETNYVFYHAEGEHKGEKVDAAHPLKGKGTITQATLRITAPTDVRRQYNGDTDVLTTQGKLSLATPLKHESAAGKNDAKTSAGVLDDVALNEIDTSKDGTGAGLSDKYYRHYNAADANADDPQSQTDYVTYHRIKLTGADAGNYRLTYLDSDGTTVKALDRDTGFTGYNATDPVDYYTMKGKGVIERRKVNAGDFHFDFAGVTKVYDGDTPVKYDKDSTKAANYITKVAVDLGGTIGERRLDYTLNEAKYLDKNVAANQGTGEVSYKLKLKGDLLKNYDFADLNNAAGQAAGYSYDSVNNAVSRTLKVGTITKRPVYAHVVNDNVTKTYNAKKNVIDESGAALSGDQLVTFDNVKNGAVQAEAGLIGADNLGNGTTASYTEKKVGDKDRTINYTLALSAPSGKAALINNYELQDENGNTAAALTTMTNTINRRALRLKADDVKKVYDANTKVKVGGADSPNDGLHFFDDNDKQWDDRLTPVQDDVKIDTVAPNVYAREYKSKNATRTEEDKKNNVNYTGIKLTGTDAANYYLADSEKNALQGNDTAGYTMTGYGEITPFQVTRANFNLKLKDLDKTYDGNAFVKDGTPENPAGWKTSHIDKSEITDGSNNHLYDLDVDKVASATYRNAGNTADDKNVGTGKKVLFKLKFTKDTLNNFDFDALETADTNGSRMIDGVYHAYDNTGKITPKDLRVKLDGYARKPYDGTADVKDVEKRLSLVKEDIVSGDDVSLGSSRGYYQQGIAAGSPKVANANIAPAAANANGYDVAYTVQSDGADRNNYHFINAADGMDVNHNGGSIYAKGDIERRKLYASTKPVEKTYNADTDVRINNALASANDLVEFHDAEGKKDAVFASGSYGTNATTAAYVANPAVPSAAAADASDTANKWVKYTLKIDGQDAGGTDYANNYVVYDAERPNTVLYDAAAGTNDGLTTTNNIINRAPLTLTAGYATKQYDGGNKVKNPSPDSLLNITGGWQGTDGGDLNRTAYTATYLNENVNKEGVDYGNIQIDPTGTTKASNYVLSYNGKDVERNGETYRLHGEGAITKRILTGNDLTPGFTTAPIEKTYDGTADVKNPSRYVNYMRTRYKKDDGTDLDLAANGYTVERADYLDKADGTKAKDVATGKDVKFQFALNDGNFDYSGLTNWKPDENGVYHFSQDYDRDASGVGRGRIKGRLVGVTLHLVQKLYDGTKDVKNGYYTREANGNLIEHKNSDVDWKQVFTLNGTHGEIAGDANSGFANGETFDFDASGSYGDKTVNRGPQYTTAAKAVDYQVKLKQDSANRNYTFQYRVVDADGRELAATDTAQTVFDASGNPTGHTFHGKGDIWQKRLTLHAAGIDRDYNGKAELTPEQRRALTFDGVASDDSAAFNFSNPNDARAAGFVDRIHGRYGDRSADAFTANAHVKRPAANINGKPEARDIEFTGVKDAFESLLQRGDVANNYFYDSDNTVYGTGTIKPLTRTLQKTWQKGAAFEKMYDGDARAMIGGKHAWESAEAKQAFHDKLRLSVDLGTGEAPIELDYSLYGDAAGDIGEPHYENFSGRTAHHGQDDANVRNSADPNDTLEKDIVYRLKSVDGDKAWQKDPNAPKYKDWELSESPVGKEVRLSDADVDNSAGLKAYITPRAITLKADEYSKIYDGTAGVAAPSLSADALAEKERELRSKLHVTDDKTRELLGRDGVDFTVDAAQSQFLGKSTYRPDADVARDAAGNVPQDGKLVEYKLSKTGGVIEQGNYVLPTGTQTDAFLGAGSITPRTVRVRFNPTDTATPDKIYDGTQYTVKDGKLFSRTFELVPQGVDEGIVATDRDGVRLNKTANIGRFASPNVQKENGGVQDVFYNDGLALTNDTGKAANYTLESGNLRDTARITPRPLDIYLKDGDIRKEYDGTTNVADKFQAANNIALLDRNRDVEGIAKPALPTWNAGDAATYDSKNAGNRTVFYNPSWTDGNFVLQKGQKTVNPTNPNDPTLGLAEIRRLEYTAVDSDGRPQMKDGVYGTRIEADGVIDRRKIKIDAARDADKIYDGKANVLNPLGNLSFKYNGANAEQNEANGLVAGEGDAVKAALRVQGVYRSNDDSTADANAADSDAQDYKKHPVRYTFEKDEARDPVLANYEIATDAGENTVKGAGVIRRRTLNVLPDPQATYARKSNVNYTGHIEDGSAQANEGSLLTPEVAADVERFNSGVFFYGPKAGTSYDAPGQSDIQGWYRKDGVSGDILASGNYGSNYTLQLKPSKLSVAPRVDSVVPERTIRPDSKVYQRAAFDESNVFGKNKDLDAALAYTGEGVNIGGMKPQGANTSDVGIRQQGTGTNIGSSAGIGGTAGVNGKVQGATSAVNEAARAAGAQPGAAVKPQGTTGGNAALAGGAAGSGGYYSPSAQPGASVKPQGAKSGAAVKPQGTTGGNAALAGGTAGLGGYYSPGAQPGASVKPQGAASVVGSAGSTVGAGSVVDRGLAAAAGMSVGSSSDARTGASGSRRSADYSSGAGSYADGSSRAADRGLANALGKGVGSAGYYSGKGYSHTDDDEEEEIKKKTKASA